MEENVIACYLLALSIGRGSLNDYSHLVRELSKSEENASSSSTDTYSPLESPSLSYSWNVFSLGLPCVICTDGLKSVLWCLIDHSPQMQYI